MDEPGPVRDLIAAAERQCAHRSFDAAIQTLQAALQLLGTDSGAMRDILEARIAAVRRSRENAHQAARLVSEARYEEIRGNIGEAFRLTCQALELDAASAEAASLRMQLSLLMPTPDPAPPAPQPVAIAPPVRADPPPPAATDAVPGLDCAEPLPLPCFALPEPPPPTNRVKDHQAALVLVYCLAVAFAIIAAGATSRLRVNLDGPIRAGLPQTAAATTPAARWDDTTYIVDSNMTMPVLISRVDPVYPPILHDFHLPATVEVEYAIDATGTPVNARILRGAGIELDVRALEALGKWRFQPGTEEGKPVAVIARSEVVFRKQ